MRRAESWQAGGWEGIALKVLGTLAIVEFGGWLEYGY